MVIDDTNDHSASLVAGGLFNPVTGRKMVLTWLAADLFPVLQEYYSDLEKELNTKFVLTLPLYRPFLSIEEQNKWQGKMSDEVYKPFVKDVLTKEHACAPIINTFGGLELNQTGAIRTKTLLTQYREMLKQEGVFLDEKLVYDDVNLKGQKVVYKQYQARKIIFAEGPGVKENPWFKDVKINRLKGEVLEIRTEIPLNTIVSRGIFILPLPGEENRCVVGSTYEHNNYSWAPSEKGKDEIENKLKNLLTCNYEVLDHRAGLRPTVVDRRPVIGDGSIFQSQHNFAFLFRI